MGEFIRKPTGELAFAYDFIKYTKLEIDDIKHTFFKIGFRLNEAEEFKYYAKLGYEDIFALSKAEFGFEKTTTKNLMAINRAFSNKHVNGSVVSYSMSIADVYDKYSQTQLVEMLPLTVHERHFIPADMTVSEIRDYKKALKDDSGWRNDKIANPKQAVENYRTIQELFNKKNKEQSDVPPGQLVINDSDEITEFHQGGGECFIDESQKLFEPVDQKEASPDSVSNEEAINRNREFVERIRYAEKCKPVKHNFKNKKEREDFIRNKDNYSILVLENEELGLSVRRLDFANGAKIYMTVYNEYSDYHKKVFQYSKLCLIDVQEKAEHTGSNASGTFSPKTYTLDGTAPTYILDYMTKFKDEI